MRARPMLVSLLVLLSMHAAVAYAADPPFKARRPLRVILYPFLPDKTGVFRHVEQSFEQSFPEIDLQVIDLSDNYYDETSIHAITNTDADVLEVDSVFIQDLIDNERIQPISSSLRASTGSMLRVAEDAVSQGPEWYGVPHWACTNYLFTRPKDPLASAATLDDLVKALGKAHPAKQGLLIDLKGRSTLGELYLDALLDKHKTLAAAAPFLSVASRDQAAIDDLKTVRTLCDSDLCRDSTYHDMVGFYARLFARDEGRALVGYSERLYYVGTETLNACRTGACKGLDQVSMVPLALSSKGSQPFAWIDSFTIAKSCSGQCLLDAEAFIRHTASVDEVRKLLIPAWGEAPRYLMPALSALYTDAELLKSAPLYGDLYPGIKSAIAIRQAGLNAALREMGGYLDKKVLPK